VFDDLYLVDFVVVDLVCVSLGLSYCLWFFLPVLILFLSILAKRLAEKSIPEIICFVSSGTLKLNFVSQSDNFTGFNDGCSSYFLSFLESVRFLHHIKMRLY